MDNRIDREKLATALQQVRRDIAVTQRDVAYALGHQTNWIHAIMVVIVADFLRGWWSLGGVSSLALSLALVSICVFVYSFHISAKAYRHLKEPVEPMWDTTVDL